MVLVCSVETSSPAFADDAYFQRDLGSAEQNFQERELKLFLEALPKMEKIPVGAQF